MKDLFGNALLDYHNGNYTEDLVTWTNISDKDVLPLPYLFRNFDAMPKLEQKALKLAKGKVLDVGCGSGSHSVWLQKQGIKVKAIDVSKNAINVCKQRGVINAEVKHLLNETETFDTILLLMNGTGIFESMAKLPAYLLHLKTLLKSKGHILIDSSDIKYMFEDEIELKNKRYYGELDYYLSYKGEAAQPITWLYLDFNTLKTQCANVGLQCKKVLDGEHYDYLAKLWL